MFFILSKLLYFLLIPFTWIMILLIWIYFIKSAIWKRRLTILTIIFTLIFSNPWLYKKANMAWQPKPKEWKIGETYQVGILLTGMVQFDTHGQGFFGSSSDRFIQTANLYHAGKIKKILVTGGSGSVLHSFPPEADFLKSMLITNGIPESDIISEPASRNTYENAIFSKKLIDSLKLQSPFLLITSAQHMRRSIAVFKKAGISVIPNPSDYKVVDKHFSLDDILIPNPRLLDDWSSLLKEVIGLWVYQLTGKA